MPAAITVIQVSFRIRSDQLEEERIEIEQEAVLLPVEHTRYLQQIYSLGHIFGTRQNPASNRTPIDYICVAQGPGQQNRHREVVHEVDTIELNHVRVH